MPIIEVGINDRRRKGKEIVRRHEIIPVKVRAYGDTMPGQYKSNVLNRQEENIPIWVDFIAELSSQSLKLNPLKPHS